MSDYKDRFEKWQRGAKEKFEEIDKQLGLKDKNLTEKDYRNYILEEYTFLKRPVVIIGDKIFSGSEKKTVENLKKAVR